MMLTPDVEPRNADLHLCQDLKTFAAEAMGRANGRPVVRLFPEPCKDLYWDAKLKRAWERHLAATLPSGCAAWRIRHQGIEVAIFPQGASWGELCQLRRGHWHGMKHLKTERICAIFARVFSRQPLAAEAAKPTALPIGADPQDTARRQQCARSFAHAVKNRVKTWLSQGAQSAQLHLLPADMQAHSYSEQALANREIADELATRLGDAGFGSFVDERDQAYVQGRRQEIHNLRTGIYFEQGLVRDFRHVRFQLRVELGSNEARDRRLAEDASKHVMQRLASWLEETSSLAAIELPLRRSRIITLHDDPDFASFFHEEAQELIDQEGVELRYDGAYSEQCSLLAEQLQDFVATNTLKSWAIVDDKAYVYRS